MDIMGKKVELMGEVLLGVVDFHISLYESSERLAQSYARFCDEYPPVARNLTEVAKKHLGVNVNLPRPPGIGREIAKLPYAEARDLAVTSVGKVVHGVRAALVDAGVGTVEWGDGDTCEFLYHDVSERRGVFRNTIRRSPNRHVLVRARIRRPDDRDVKLPEKAQAIMADLLPRLQREARVIVGTVVVQERGDDEVRRELTAAGRAAVKAGRIGRQVGTAGMIAGGAALAGVAGVAVVGGGALAKAVGSMGSALAAVAPAVFLLDPVLVIGDVCFAGWLDG